METWGDDRNGTPREMIEVLAANLNIINEAG
jgi:hypothetical protein